MDIFIISSLSTGIQGIIFTSFLYFRFSPNTLNCVSRNAEIKYGFFSLFSLYSPFKWLSPLLYKNIFEEPAILCSHNLLSVKEFSIALFYNTFTALMLAVLKDNWNFNNEVNLLLAFVPFRLKEYLFSSDG